MKRRVTVGDHAPDFSLMSQRGENVRLSDYQGKSTVVLFFYPKDNSPGCTKEACKFRDNYATIKDAGAEVMGISSQSEESHGIFSINFALPYYLLSDPDGKVRKAYGVPSTFGLIPGRVTYVVDKKGIVRYIFKSQVKAEQHAIEALRVVKSLAAENL
jgi:peroxiredoxin Q/BCP